MCRDITMSVCRTINKKTPFSVAGLDMDAEQTIWEADLKGPLAVVIGSEGAGMSRLVGEKCDFMLRIPMAGEISSLNAAVSFAIVAYERVRQRGI